VGAALALTQSPTTPQYELWLASKVGGDDANRSFNECSSLSLRGALDAARLEAALRTLLARHEALRCAFAADGQRFTVLPVELFALARHDLAAFPEAERARSLAELVSVEVTTAFVLERAPLFRATLIRLAADAHQLLLTAHHAVCDSWSVGVLSRELAALYRAGASAEEAGLAPAPSFAAYAAALRARAESDAGARDEAFWTSLLAGELKQIDLPTDRPRPARRTYASNRLDLALDAGLVEPLRRLGAHAGCALPATVLGVFQAWLYRLTGQRDLVLGLQVARPAGGAGESDPSKYAGLVGHAVHVLPLRTTVEPATTLAAHLAAFGLVMGDALRAREVTFSRLLRKLDLPFDPSRAPLVPVCLDVEGGLGALDFGELAATHATVPRAYESFELFVNAVDQGPGGPGPDERGGLVLQWSYNTALFDEATIRRWMGELETLLRDALARPDAAIRDLAVLPAAELELLERGNRTRRPLAGVPVHEQVAAHALRRPEDVAVRFGARALTYGELDQRANQLARHLRGEGAREGDCIGVYLERSESLPMVLLAVLKCGAAYVPMDPLYPPDRLAMMAEDGAVKIVVTEAGLLPTMPKVQKALCLDELGAALAAEDAGPLGIAVAGSACAYVLFTSGSTGRPKGVEIPHGALENFLASMRREPGFGPHDRLLAITTVSFDIAGLELFLPLVTGGTIFLADRAQAVDPEALVALLAQYEITMMQATPATWRMLIDAGWQGRAGLRVLCGGEAMAPGLAAELIDRTSELWNMYGPTETTVYSTAKRQERGARVTIGHAIDNTNVYVLDADGQRVPVGATGELWIGGAGVALGYRGRPDLTSERFVDDPFAPGERMYRTGDLGRVLPDGEIDCLGRADSQVKLRGFRIELAEIEAAIEQLPGVRKSVVKLLELGQAAQLVAYWTADTGVEVAALKAHLQKMLPPYMVPAHYVLMDAWPMTPAGKIDRKILPAPRVEAREGGDPLRDDFDARVAEIWQELLGVTELGLEDDFFALGGQSLLAVRFVAAVKARLGVPFSLATLFAAPTLREVSDAIRDGGGRLERGAVVLRREPGAPRVFFICGVHLYRALALALGEGFESHGVVVLGDELLEAALGTNTSPKVDVPALLAEYFEAIRRVQPQGPYHLAGVSFGGVLAYELARALRAAGETIGTLALLDPVLPSSVQRDRLRQLQRHLKDEGIWKLGARVAKKLMGPQPNGGDAQDEPDDEPNATTPTPTPRSKVDADAAAAVRLGELRNQAYDNAIAEWDKTAPSYDGDAVLFRALDVSKFGDDSIVAPDLGWRRLVHGKLFIHELPGNHLGILEKPNVARLAEILRQYLRAERADP
jgi:amino acid adenylation domain-containing protein